MFKCQLCKKVSKPKEPQITVVAETRPVIYRQSETRTDEEGVETVVHKEQASGWEIVKELKVCLTCSISLKG
jgi:hypothetical protein